jgi:heme/copper-type cytochrome/quinol oxidase subunit 2
MVYHQELQKMSANIDRNIIKMQNNAQLYIKILNVTIIALILAILALFFFFVKFAVSESKLSPEEKHVGKPLKIAALVVGLTFLLLALAFAVTGFLSISKLKRFFPDFYIQNRKMLLFAVIGLSTSLLLRGTVDSLRYFSKSFTDKMV